MRRPALAGCAALAWSALLWAGCGDLVEIPENRCGNEVVEANEDCDTFVADADKHVCIGPGAPGQCRFSCGALPDGTVSECPSGYGCGNDGICRRPSGSVARRERTGLPVGAWFDAADFDGDGDDDIVSVSETHLAVDYLEGGTYRQSYRVPIAATGLPSLADVDADNRADVLVPTELGLAVFRSIAGRSLTPTTYASLSILIDRFEFVSIDLVPEVVEIDGELRRFSGDEPLTVTDIGAFVLANEVYPGFHEPPMAGALGFDVASFRGFAAVASFDETPDEHPPYTESPEQFAVAVQGDDADEILLVRPSWFVDGAGTVRYFVDARTEEGEAKPDVPASHPDPGHITFGDDRLASPVLALQVNQEGPDVGFSRIVCGMERAVADEHMDLVFEARADGGNGPVRAYVAYGVGDGTFHSDPCELDEIAAATVMPDNQAAPSDELAGCSAILAAGDIDGDGFPDLVTSVGVSLSGLIPAGEEERGYCDPDVTLVPHPDFETWTVAVIADLNGDGRNDVLAGERDSLGVDLLVSNPGSLLSHAKLATFAGITRMRVGDFDGDQVADVALVENRGSEDTLTILFGESGEIPDEPLEVGTFPAIRAVVAGNVTLPDNLIVDGVDDLFVASRAEGDTVTRVAALYGRPDRHLQAPFTYSTDVGIGVADRYFPAGAVVAPFDLGCEGDGDAPGRALVLTGNGQSLAPTTGAPGEVMAAACVEEGGALTALGATESALELPADLFVERTAMTAFDLGTPEAPDVTPIMFAWNELYDERRIVLMVPRSSGSGADLAWEMGPMATIEGATPAGVDATDVERVAVSQVRRWSEYLANVPESCTLLGADAPPTLVFMAVHDAGPCDEDSSADLAAETRVHILPAATILELRESGTLGGAREVVLEGDNTILGFACMNADEDPEQELALLTIVGQLDACGGGPAAELEAQIVLLDFDEDGSWTARAEPWAKLTDDEVFQLGSPDAEARQPALSGLTRGDFDGDGVDDLAASALTDTFIWLGKPVNP